MGRRKKQFVTAENIGEYISDTLKDGIQEIAFDPNKDIYNLRVKKKKKESKSSFMKRQNRKIKHFVEKYLYIDKDGENIPIKLIAKQVILIADVFYRRKRNGKLANKIILWAARGGGKGVTISVLLFLLMVYRSKSALDLAGSQDQAMVVYEYTKGFLSKCIPIVADKLLDGKPLQSKTKLKNGVQLKCIANSATQTRGKHPSILAADEACQEDTGKDKNVKSAINMVFSEKEYTVMLFSTWHVPIGIFQEYWDQADKRGFVKYKWDVYDTAQKCTLPDKCIFCNGRGKEDGGECEFCLGKGKVDCKKCKLTRKVKEYDLEGELIGFSYDGCNGKCLTTDGYAPIQNIFDAYASNDIEIWTTEFECSRPRTKGPVYNLESVWDCFIYNDEIILPKHETTRTMGIDWGWAGQTSIIGPAIDCEGHVSIVEEWYMTKPSISEIINYLKRMTDMYGEFMIFADSSHPFENASLVEAGFGLWYDKRRRDTEAGVVFNKWKDWGIGNLRKYWDKGRVKISLDNCPDLWEYLKIYKMGADGKPIKKMDHGPDALLCAMLGHPFVEEALSPKKRAEIAAEREAKGFSHKDSVLTFGGAGDGKRKKNR